MRPIVKRKPDKNIEILKCFQDITKYFFTRLLSEEAESVSV